MKSWALDAVVANAENSAPDGAWYHPRERLRPALRQPTFSPSETTPSTPKDTRSSSKKRTGWCVPPTSARRSPGWAWALFEAGGVTVGVTNVLGRVFVERTKISPFEAADLAVEELKARGADLVLVDSHAEATSEKLALGHYLDGRAQAVFGHPHARAHGGPLHPARRNRVRDRRRHDRLQGKHHWLRTG